MTYVKNLDQYKIDVNAFKKSQNNLPQLFSIINQFENKSQEPSQAVSSSELELQQPKYPKKPEFCAEKNITQYIFDGCTVQVNF